MTQIWCQEAPQFEEVDQAEEAAVDAQLAAAADDEDLAAADEVS